MRCVMLALGAAWIALGAFAAPHDPAVRTFEVDPSSSAATIEVGKAGPLSFVAGHAHEVDAPGVRGTVRLAGTASAVDLTIPVASMGVAGAHESAADRPKIQETMLSAEVLDARNHPTFSFRSTSVAVHAETATAMDVVVDGRLTIRGTARVVSVPVHADLAGPTLTAAGRLTVRQSDYGIKPVSVGGVVAVKDALTITFHIVGRERR